MVKEDGPVREDAMLFLMLYRGPGMVGHRSPADALRPDHHLRVRAVVGEQPAMRFAPAGPIGRGSPTTAFDGGGSSLVGAKLEGDLVHG